MKSKEAHLQYQCVTWFRMQFKKYKNLLFAVPNGGTRHPIEAVNLKRQGTIPGVADLILLTSRRGYSSLCIEMKAGKNKQTEFQKEWQQSVESEGNLYRVVYSFDEFVKLISWYLS